VDRRREPYRSQLDAEPLETTFELSDTLYAKALVPPPNEVYLWLGVSCISKGRCDSFLTLQGERNAGVSD
jgi:hypothetical protein